MTPFLALIALMLPVALGYSLISLLDTRKIIPTTLRLALAYGLGSGLLTLWMFLLGALHMPLTIQTLNYPLATFLAICLLFISKSAKRSFSKRLRHAIPSFSLDPLSFLFLLFILLQTGYVFWRSFTVPVSAWDAFATHTFNAKILFYEQSLKYLSSMPHNNYPLHVPLLQAWLALNLGQWDDLFIHAIFPLYFLSTLIVQYHFLRTYVSIRWSLLGLGLLVSSPFLIYHATIGYRDFSMLYYNFTTIVLLLLWHRKKKNAHLVLAALFAGITSFVKLEGIGYLAIHLVLLTTILAHEQSMPLFRKFRLFFTFFIPAVSVCLIFHVYQHLIHPGTLPPNNNAFGLYSIGLEHGIDYIGRLSTVLGKIIQNLFFSGNWNLLWLILSISVLQLIHRGISVEIKLLFLALILFAAIYLPAYTLTQHYYWISQTETVLSRCILHILPLATVLIVLINFSKKS